MGIGCFGVQCITTVMCVFPLCRNMVSLIFEYLFLGIHIAASVIGMYGTTGIDMVSGAYRGPLPLGTVPIRCPRFVPLRNIADLTAHTLLLIQVFNFFRFVHHSLSDVTLAPLLILSCAYDKRSE